MSQHVTADVIGWFGKNDGPFPSFSATPHTKRQSLQTMSIVKLEPKRLPLEPPAYEDCIIDRGTYLNAYKRVLSAERQATERLKGNSIDETAHDDMISARVAGYLFIEFWNQKRHLTVEPCRDIVTSLASQHRDGGEDHCKTVFAIGKFYRDYLLRLFHTCTEKYQTPSTRPSRSSFDTTMDMVNEIMKPDGKYYTTARYQALARDGFRCVLTGAFNGATLMENNELADMCETLPDCPITTVMTCHILNESTMQRIDLCGDGNDGSVVNKTDYAANCLALLATCIGLEGTVEGLLLRNGIHDLGNLISLDPLCHGHFNNLELWFETTDEPNRYRVCVTRLHHRKYILRSGHLSTDPLGDVYITFTQPNEGLKFPDPKLLGLHAVCARVAHMSGAAEAFKKLERDAEEVLVLSANGSSAPLINHCLTPFVTVPGVA